MSTSEYEIVVDEVSDNLGPTPYDFAAAADLADKKCGRALDAAEAELAWRRSTTTEPPMDYANWIMEASDAVEEAIGAYNNEYAAVLTARGFTWDDELEEFVVSEHQLHIL
jgi:hypothetical protein